VLYVFALSIIGQESAMTKCRSDLVVLAATISENATAISTRECGGRQNVKSELFQDECRFYFCK
jgi:hypothetical protein